MTSASLELPIVDEVDEIDDTMKLTEIELHCSKWRIGLRFTAIWEDEQDLGILIDDGVVGRADYPDPRDFA